MKKSLCLLGVLALCAIASADNIAYWSLNDGTQVDPNSSLWRINPLGTVDNKLEYSRDIGTGVARLSTWMPPGDPAAGDLVGVNGGPQNNNFGSYTGTTLNVIDPNIIAGGSLSILGSDNNNHYFLLELDDAIADCVLTYATRGTSTGFDTHWFDYSTDGGATWTAWGTLAANKTSTWTVSTADFGDVFASTSGSNINLIRISLTGASSTNGNNRFDNILITGTIIPEPAGFLLGLVLVGLARRR